MMILSYLKGVLLSLSQNESCQKFNCTKLGSLPPEKFLEELINRKKLSQQNSNIR